MLIKDQRIRPGDLVRFDFWSTYLAPTPKPDINGHVNWYELSPGDQGLVVGINHEVTSSKSGDDTVTVMFSRHNKLLKVHINQLRRADEHE